MAWANITYIGCFFLQILTNIAFREGYVDYVIRSRGANPALWSDDCYTVDDIPHVYWCVDMPGVGNYILYLMVSVLCLVLSIENDDN